MSEENEPYVNPNFTPEVEAQPTEAEASAETEAVEGAEPSPTPTKPAAVPVEEEKKDGVQKRVDELTRKRREAERDRDRLAAENEALRTAQAKPAAVPQNKPVVDQFETYEDFVEALADWKTDQKVSEFIAKKDNEQAKTSAQQAQAAVLESFEKKKDDAAIKYPDFDMVINGADVSVTDAMRDAILDSDVSGEVMYYLAKNPAEAARLVNMPPGAVFREVGKIEMKLSTPTKPPATNAAAPITPVSGNEYAKKSVDDITDDDEWLRAERKRLKGLGRLY